MSNGSTTAVGVHARFRHGVTWNIMNVAFTQGSIFLTNVVLANMLGTHVYGQYGMIYSTLMTMTSIAQVATGVTATKYVSEFRSTDKEKAGRILGLCAIVSLITAFVATMTLLVAAHPLAAHTLNAPHLARGLMIATGFVMFSVINGYQAGALAGFEAYHSLAKNGVLQGTVHALVCTLAAWNFGLEGALGGLTVSALFRWYIYKRALDIESLKNCIKVTYENVWIERKIIYRFALPAAISGLTTMPALWLANTFLVEQKDGYSQMGLYSASNMLRAMVLVLPAVLNTVGTSIMNNEMGAGDEGTYRRVFWLNLKISIGVILCAAIIIALLGSNILRIYGRDFVEGYPILLILMLSTLFEGAAVTLYQIIQCSGKMWLSFFAIALPRDSLLILLAYIFTPLYGAVGLAVSFCISWLVTCLIIAIISYSIGFGFTAGKQRLLSIEKDVPKELV